jgi:hypothetical protein
VSRDKWARGKGPGMKDEGLRFNIELPLTLNIELPLGLRVDERPVYDTFLLTMAGGNEIIFVYCIQYTS